MIRHYHIFIDNYSNIPLFNVFQFGFNDYFQRRVFIKITITILRAYRDKIRTVFRIIIIFQPYRTPVKFNHTLFTHTKNKRANYLIAVNT